MSDTRFGRNLEKGLVAVRRERKTHTYFLERLDGAQPGQRIPLEKNEVIVGRAKGVDVELSSTLVSRFHALMSRRGVDYVIRDNESQNGTFLNGVRIHSAILREGDVIHAADCGFVYREG